MGKSITLREEFESETGAHPFADQQYIIWLEKKLLLSNCVRCGLKISIPHLTGFGFVKDDNGNYCIDLHTHYLELMPSNAYWHPTYVQVPEMSHEDEQRVSTNRIEFVHELQNLFFALTGRELEMKIERSTCG